MQHDDRQSDHGAGRQTGRGMSPWATAVLCVAALAALALAALPTLLYPLTRDQGAYAYQAEIMRQGGALFRDVWESKGPGVQMAYWLAFVLFGRSESAVRLFDVLYALLSAACVYLVAQETFQDRRVAACSAWLYAFCYYWLVRFHSMATPEAFMAPFLLGSIYGLVRGVRRQSTPTFLLAGVAGGFVFWSKPTAGLIILAVLAWACVALWRGRWGWDKIGRALGAAALGGLLGILPFGLYLYGRGLAELVEIWRVYGTGAYLGARGLALGDGPLAILDVIVGYLRDWQLLVWLSLAGAAAVLARRHRMGAAVIVFLLSSVASMLLQVKLFEYHWIPILGPAAILTGLALIWLWDEIDPKDRPCPTGTLRRDMRSVFAAVTILGILSIMGYDRLALYRRTAAYLAGRLSADQYYAQFNIGEDFSHIGALQAAAYLREHTKPDETVFIWGSEALVNFLAERRSPTRYIWSCVLVGDGGQDPGLEAWRLDLMADLGRAPPTYFMLVENDVTPLSPQGSRVQLEEIPALKRLLEADYTFETRVEDYLFYRRTAGTVVSAWE